MSGSDVLVIMRFVLSLLLLGAMIFVYIDVRRSRR